MSMGKGNVCTICTFWHFCSLSTPTHPIFIFKMKISHPGPRHMPRHCFIAQLPILPFPTVMLSANYGERLRDDEPNYPAQSNHHKPNNSTSTTQPQSCSPTSTLVETKLTWRQPNVAFSNPRTQRPSGSRPPARPIATTPICTPCAPSYTDSIAISMIKYPWRNVKRYWTSIWKWSRFMNVW